MTTAKYNAIEVEENSPVPDYRQSNSPAVWDLEADVVVLGAGATGMTAALTASDGGASVIVLEKAHDVGGRALFSGGYVDIGGGTRAQMDLGQEDSVDAVYRDLIDHATEARKNDPSLMRRFAEESPGVMRWLEEKGVKFIGIADVTPLPGVASGRMHIAGWDEEGTQRSPGRLYRTGTLTHSGAGLMRPLEASARAQGVDFRVNHCVTRIFRDAETGKVTGVAAEHEGGTVRIRARRGVVVATAGLNGNPQLRRTFDPRLGPEYAATGEPLVTLAGEGVVAAQTVGAQLASDFGLDGHWVQPRVPIHTLAHEGIMGAPLGCRYATLHHKLPLPDSPAVKAQGVTGLSVSDLANIVLVKQDGRRFFDEDTKDERGFCDAALANGGGPVWAVFDANGAEREGWTTFDSSNVEPGYFHSAATVDELAAAMSWDGRSVDAATLRATIERYNSFVDAGEDEDFRRTNVTYRIDTGPFFAAWATPFLHDPYGGLRIDEKCQVVDIYGEPIPGLFAGGEAVGGIARVGTGKAILTGRVAGLALVGH